MYRYDQIDQRLVEERVAQFRDQTRRFLAGQLAEDDFKSLRLRNGLYMQKHAPMLRVSIPYGLLSTQQVREARSGSRKIHRRDFYISAPATTNNRMALSGAIAVLQLLARKGARLQVLAVSDSQYLVKGMREWVPGWIGRGWKRKEGPIENLELWQTLVKSVRLHEDVQWTWVRGHQDHAKNIYADQLAVAAAREQKTSDGIVESGFDPWFVEQRAKGKFAAYDPDAAFAALEERVAAGESFALAE